MDGRFSKATLAEYVLGRANRLDQQYHFDSDNGTAQLNGKPEAVHLAYGEWNTLLNIAEDFGLYDHYDGEVRAA